MPKKKGPRQGILPGDPKQQIADLIEGAEIYVALRDKRMATLRQEIEAAGVLLQRMHTYKLESYALPDGSVIEVEGTEKVKVRRPKKTRDEEEE